MQKPSIEELESEDMWDFERAETHRPSRPARAVVSVAFARDDFDAVVECARENDMKLSEFIRAAALDRVRQLEAQRLPVAMSTSQTGQIRGTVTRAARYKQTNQDTITV